MLKLLGTVIYKTRGWTFESLPDYWQPKQVIIGFPHTTWQDTMMAFAGFAMVEQKGHIVVKKEAFRWPLGGMLKGLGGVAIDRKSPTGLVAQLVAEFEARETFQLALVPEGTRKGAARLRTGFWHVAKGAGVPIVCWYLDGVNKRTRWLGQFEPGDDLDADLRLIRKLYGDAGHEITAPVQAPSPATG
jgi:1-acyl-sn-glycerol-3-phosphate acyltransferase